MALSCSAVIREANPSIYPNIKEPLELLQMLGDKSIEWALEDANLKKSTLEEMNSGTSVNEITRIAHAYFLTSFQLNWIDAALSTDRASKIRFVDAITASPVLNFVSELEELKNLDEPIVENVFSNMKKFTDDNSNYLEGALPTFHEVIHRCIEKAVTEYKGAADSPQTIACRKFLEENGIDLNAVLPLKNVTRGDPADYITTEDLTPNVTRASVNLCCCTFHYERRPNSKEYYFTCL